MLRAHFSPAIYESVVALISHLDLLQSINEAAVLNHSSSLGSMPNRVEASVFGIFVSVNLESVSLYIDLANNGENSSVLNFSVQKLDIRLVITTEFVLGIHIFLCATILTVRIIEHYVLVVIAVDQCCIFQSLPERKPDSSFPSVI